MVTAKKVANVLLSWANRDGDVITNLKLQKLLYYAQAWYLVNFGRRLFVDNIQAWEFGPVVRDVYNTWKKYQSSPIPYQVTGQEQNGFQRHQIEFLEDFYNVFSSLSATALVSMSHAERPWKEAYARRKNSIIEPSAMKEYYSKKYEKEYKNS